MANAKGRRWSVLLWARLSSIVIVLPLSTLTERKGSSFLCSIGIIGEKEPPDEKTKGERATKEAELGIQKCKVFGMEIKALTEGEEPRAVDSSGSGEQAVKHSAVQQYLSRAFGARYRLCHCNRDAPGNQDELSL